MGTQITDLTKLYKGYYLCQACTSALIIVSRIVFDSLECWYQSCRRSHSLVL